LPDELATIWDHTRAELKASLPESTYQHWLAPVRPVALTPDALELTAPGRILPWIERRYSPLIREALSRVGLSDRRLVFLRPQDVDDAVGPVSDEPVLPPSARKYTFDQFVIGAANQFAHSAALHVAESPAQAYNPLFLYGSPGLGKSHLLGAIADYVRDHSRGLRIQHSTAEAFAAEFIRALQRRELDAFKDRYRSVDVLLIDDVQFLEGKRQTGEEFFHTFNALYEAGSQLVFSCDRQPDEMGELELRLRQRFEWGLLAPIGAPDHDTRVAILRKRADWDCVRIPDPATFDAIAARVTDNVRRLEGALIRIVAFASLHSREIDAGLVEEALGPLPGSLSPPTIDSIQDTVATFFGLTADQLTGRDRRAVAAYPRQLAMYLSRQLTDASLPRIGAAFGGRDHTTVLHACQKIGARISADPEASTVVARLRAAVQSGLPYAP
jgi:chromosomal replication initiator protein